MSNEEKEIEEALKVPFDYGSEEYLKVITKIKAYRDKYRAEQEVNKVLKYKYIDGVYEK